MTTLKLIGFGGEVPKLQPRQLPDTHAQYAYNCRLENGALVPLNKPLYTASIGAISKAKTIYKFGDTWLAWDKVVNAAPAPVAEDRLYYTGDGVPKMRVGLSVYPLAVPFPPTKLTVTPSGTGTGDVISRIYVYTNVTSFGEESEPCPASDAINWQSGMTVTLSGFTAPPAGRSITRQRIYRTQTGSSGDTNLYFIAERPASTADFTDTVLPSAIGERLPSLTYNAPPDDLEGLISLPNGMMAGFVGKKLYFSEPYIPHAWPEKYILTTEYDIMGIGAFGSSIAVATTGLPYVVEGTAPENMTMARLETNLPCVNKRGLVDMGYGIAYPSNDGLVLVQSGSAQVITSSIISRLDWQGFNPKSFVSGQCNGRYMASYQYTDSNSVIQTGTLIIDVTGATSFLMRSNVVADAFYYDVETSALYFSSDISIYEYDPVGGEPGNMVWKSKLFTLPTPLNYGAIMIDGGTILSADDKAKYEYEKQQAAIANAAAFIGTDAGTITVLPYIPKNSYLNGGMIGASMVGATVAETWTDIIVAGVLSMRSEVNAGLVNEFALNGDPLDREYLRTESAVVRVLANQSEIATISDLNELKRLPSGVRARFWEIQIEGNTTIYEVDMGITAAELRGI